MKSANPSNGQNDINGETIRDGTMEHPLKNHF
jgi:hypothetical protein